MASPKEEVMVIKYYYSKSAKLTLSSFVKEEYFPSGKRKQGDIPIQFREHFYITSNPAEQRFIERSQRFKDKVVWEVTKQAFDELTAKHALKVDPTGISQSIHPQMPIAEAV